MCSNGIMASVLFSTINALRQAGFGGIWEALHEFVQLWEMPAFLKPASAKHVFTSTKVEAHKKGSKIKSTASEMLSLYRIIEFYCSGLQLPACEAFKKWCHVLGILVSIPELKPLPGVLQHACEAALDATIKQIGETISTPSTTGFYISAMHTTDPNFCLAAGPWRGNTNASDKLVPCYAHYC